MHKRIILPVFHAALATVILLSGSLAHGQQLDERESFAFKVLGSNAALNKAIAIEQVEDGFGTDSYVTSTTTTNDSTSVGTLAEITAILEGDNSDLTLTSNPVQDSTGSTMTSSSDQTSNNTLSVSH